MNDTFVGFVALGSTLKDVLLVRNGSDVPIDADAAPSYKIFGPAGLMTNGAGTLTDYKHTGSITGATNASPIVITSASHGLATGTRVTISGVLTNTNANGTFVVTSTGANTFSLDGSTGNGTYGGGGTFHASGLYDVSLAPTSNNGYASGVVYQCVFNIVVSATTYGAVHSFCVV